VSGFGASTDPEVTRIVAVRHGETVWNAEMRMQGQLDTALSERGRRQAARAAEALAGEGIEAIVSSDLVRAFDTAAAIADRVGLPVATDPGLRERSFGMFQGYTYAEIDARWPDQAARWRRHDPSSPRRRRAWSTSTRAVAAVTAIATRAGSLDPRRHARRRARLPVSRSVGLGLDAPRSWSSATRRSIAPLHRRALHAGRLERHLGPRGRNARRRERGRLPDRAARGGVKR
jgi:probable phosphoglycerate mutase